MRTSLTINGAKLFNIKQLGSGCRFGIKVSSKKQDGSYTKGTFINCKSRDMLDAETFYTLIGFLGDNEYNGNNTIEFIVMTATPEVLERKQNTGVNAPVHRERKPMPQIPELDFDLDEVPF
jgi:hypothetical protein